jgi:putative ABC transport system substrate-binding protein
MRRRAFAALVGSVAVAVPLDALGQRRAGKVPRVGWLGLGSASGSIRGVHALETGFRDLGYAVGKSIVIEFRFADGRFERLDALATEMIRNPVDVMFVATTAAALAAKNATATIPIVFANVRDPVASGLVASLARPGGNITGLAWEVSADLVGKQLQLLQEIRPGASHFAVLWNPGGGAGNARTLAEVQRAASSFGIRLLIVEARQPGDLLGAFQMMAAERVEALLVMADVMLYEERESLGKLASSSGLPTMYGSREDMADGGLLAYGASRLDLIRRAAGLIDKILKGAKPGDLPIEQPTQFELVIDLKTARMLGMEIPASVLARADEVIE